MSKTASKKESSVPVDVITGLIKANVPSRIAFAVAAQVDSRVILDSNGAEKLLGRGDLLFAPIDGGGRTTRVQGAYVSEEEVAAVCRVWTSQANARYDLDIEGGQTREQDEDELYEDAVVFARERGQMSTSMLQRRFSIGFQRANRILERMEAEKVVGPRDGPRPREVLAVGEEAVAGAK